MACVHLNSKQSESKWKRLRGNMSFIQFVCRPKHDVLPAARIAARYLGRNRLRHPITYKQYSSIRLGLLAHFFAFIPLPFRIDFYFGWKSYPSLCQMNCTPENDILLLLLLFFAVRPVGWGWPWQYLPITAPCCTRFPIREYKITRCCQRAPLHSDDKPFIIAK